MALPCFFDIKNAQTLPSNLHQKNGDASFTGYFNNICVFFPGRRLKLNKIDTQGLKRRKNGHGLTWWFQL